MSNLHIKTIFDESDGATSSLFSNDQIKSFLIRLFSHEFSLTQEADFFDQNLPKIKWFRWNPNSLNFSFFLLCRHRADVSKFFCEMLSRCLLPGKTLPIRLQFSTNFQLSQCKEKKYSISEVVICFENEQEIESMEHNLSFIEREILMGTQSFYQANLILEMLGPSFDEKTAKIQEKITHLARRFPENFDYDIFSQMQYFLVFCKEAFKSSRSALHLSRIIYILYLLRKQIENDAERHPNKRHLIIKVRRAYINDPFKVKEVLSFYIGINFLNEHEFFEEKQLLAALSNLRSDFDFVEDSYFTHENKGDKTDTFYLEIEKKNGGCFSQEEIQFLKKFLGEEIKNRIKQLVPPMFMPRNEEEVMRNILSLSQQIKYLKDMPQVIISFLEQSTNALCFTVILVRILFPNSRTVRDLLEESALDNYEFSLDRTKMIGMVRRKYPKEANVFRITLPLEDFLREDYSVDLYLARLFVVEKLKKVFGQIRDYNGGMMAKQNENYLSLKKALGSIAKKHALILQNFFHSIFPMEFSATSSPHLLKKLFILLIQTLEKGFKQSFYVDYENKEGTLFLVIKFQEPSLKERFYNVSDYLKINSRELISIQLSISEHFYFGFIYLCNDLKKQQLFLDYIFRDNL